MAPLQHGGRACPGTPITRAGRRGGGFPVVVLTQQLQKAQYGLHDKHGRAHLVALYAFTHLMPPVQAGAQRIAG